MLYITLELHSILYTCIIVIIQAQRQQVENPDIPEETMYAQLSDVQVTRNFKLVDIIFFTKY